MPSDGPQILIEDGPLLAVNKPAGLLTLGASEGIPTLERQVKAWLKQRYDKPGNVYLGIPHRLDRPVSGVVVFSRNSKGAARLAEQFRERQVRKVYWALVERAPQPDEGELVDWLLKTPDQAHVEVVAADTPGAREARLRYRVIDAAAVASNAEIRIKSSLAQDGGTSDDVATRERLLLPRFETGGDRRLLEIELLTGRMHQIRVQLASRGWPVFGDVQYGAAPLATHDAAADPRDAPIALHARSLTVRHPVRYEPLTIEAPLPANWCQYRCAELKS
ncbi:MAG: RNA pseudouridine synthase [Planctomycetaceae bacterium]|nr:RNA pseudouridine synthase [Planctomycetaceae bacterium]